MRRVLTSLQGWGIGTTLVVVAVAAIFASRARPTAGVARQPPVSRANEAVSPEAIATRTPITLPDNFLDLCRTAGL